jgi:hypothetical protein
MISRLLFVLFLCSSFSYASDYPSLEYTFTLEEEKTAWKTCQEECHKRLVFFEDCYRLISEPEDILDKVELLDQLSGGIYSQVQLMSDKKRQDTPSSNHHILLHYTAKVFFELIKSKICFTSASYKFLENSFSEYSENFKENAYLISDLLSSVLQLNVNLDIQHQFLKRFKGIDSNSYQKAQESFQELYKRDLKLINFMQSTLTSIYLQHFPYEGHYALCKVDKFPFLILHMLLKSFFITDPISLISKESIASVEAYCDHLALNNSILKLPRKLRTTLKKKKDPQFLDLLKRNEDSLSKAQKLSQSMRKRLSKLTLAWGKQDPQELEKEIITIQPKSKKIKLSVKEIPVEEKKIFYSKDEFSFSNSDSLSLTLDKEREKQPLQKKIKIKTRPNNILKDLPFYGEEEEMPTEESENTLTNFSESSFTINDDLLTLIGNIWKGRTVWPSWNDIEKTFAKGGFSVSNDTGSSAVKFTASKKILDLLGDHAEIDVFTVHGTHANQHKNEKIRTFQKVYLRSGLKRMGLTFDWIHEYRKSRNIKN